MLMCDSNSYLLIEHILCTNYYLPPLVLRRVIEDRAAILALTTRSAENEAALMKAKTRQLNIIKNLDQQDEEIARLTTKAKAELVEYHKKSKEYIQSFIQAFQDGDLNMLPQHPFVPLLHELEQAINQRKATLIEKVQSDDRVKRLEDQLSRERVPSSAVKKNEGEYNDNKLNVPLHYLIYSSYIILSPDTFWQVLDISKQQLSNGVESYLTKVDALLHQTPHSHKFDDIKVCTYTMILIGYTIDRDITLCFFLNLGFNENKPSQINQAKQQNQLFATEKLSQLTFDI